VSIATDDVDLDRDRQLVERCQGGDPAAFGDLYAIYHDRLVRHCRRRLGGGVDAEDVAQEAFIRAWRALDRFEAGRSFYCWLSVIASNACTDALRRRRPTTSLADVRGEAALDGRRGVEEHLTTAFDAALAHEAMQQLTDRHRRVLHLREQLDWSVEDIALHEGLRTNAVDTLLWRARASLRRKFHALSEGAAAVIATGGTRFVLARNRAAHVVHRAGGAGGSSVRVRAAMATVVALGVGAAATPVVWSHAPSPAPGVGTTAGIDPGHGGGPRVTGPGHSTAPPPAMPGPRAASAGAPSGAPAGPPVPSAPGPVGPQGAGTGGGTGNAVPPVVSPTTGGPAASGVLSTAAGAVQAAAGTFQGTVGGVVTVVGGTVQATPVGPAVAPVVQAVSGVGGPISVNGVVGAPGVPAVP
jgi:RNA polymerase sigma-70 factor, ECF subfamily